MDEQKDNKLSQTHNIRHKSMEAPKDNKQTINQNNTKEKLQDNW